MEYKLSNNVIEHNGILISISLGSFLSYNRSGLLDNHMIPKYSELFCLHFWGVAAYVYNGLLNFPELNEYSLVVNGFKSSLRCLIFRGANVHLH